MQDIIHEEYNPYNLYNLRLQFKLFLVDLKKSNSTLKNYLSDLGHFLGWISQKKVTNNTHVSSQNLLEKISTTQINKYCSTLLKKNTPIKTINRRLSTIRLFCSFCVQKKFISSDPSTLVANVKMNPVKSDEKNTLNLQNNLNRINDDAQNLYAQFKNYLVSLKKSSATLKNYLSDLRNFIAWFAEAESVDIKLLQSLNIDSLRTISSDSINSYRVYLTSQNSPPLTINRRLSTIRLFCFFCVNRGWMVENPSLDVPNVQFARHSGTKVQRIDPTIKLNGSVNDFIFEQESVNEEKTVIDDVIEFNNFIRNK